MLKSIVKSIGTGNYLVTRHAKEEMIADNLTLMDILTSVDRGRIIEDYPEDLPFPSFLIFGKNDKGEPIHTVWGHDRERQLAILITTYRPDPERWIDFKKRRWNL